MTEFTTTQTGAPVASDAHSLTAGADGATVLHDRYLVEKLAQFNRERIPERIVHAKGGGAFGEFVVTEDVSQYTKAAVFQPGAKSEMLLRFSSVAGEQGSPDTWRDVRGFSLKFYTTEGNYDIVGNNTPVFFIRDAIKFPDFIHSQKRLPGSGLRDADMQWDFWTLSPESAHQVTYLMGDRGLPKSWRDDERLRLAHVPVDQRRGRAVLGASTTSSRARATCYLDATTRPRRSPVPTPTTTVATCTRRSTRGEFPTWDVYVQVMPYEDAKTYRFNPFDLTKTWSTRTTRASRSAHYTLNRNPQNFFAEIEQAAFSPANTVPGHRHQPRQDAHGARVLVPRRAALPRRHELQPAPGERAARRTGAQLLAGRRAAPRLQPPRRAGLRAELVRRPGRRPGSRERGRLGVRRRARPRRRHAARRGRRLRPGRARSTATSSTPTRRRASWRPSPARATRSRSTRSASASSSTGRTSTSTSAPSCAQRSATRHPPRSSRADVPCARSLAGAGRTRVSGDDASTSRDRPLHGHVTRRAAECEARPRTRHPERSTARSTPCRPRDRSGACSRSRRCRPPAR